MAKLILGCGYLGQRVAERWQALGEHVWASTRSLERAATIESPLIWPIYCDVLLPETLVNLEPADTILYCVGFDRTTGDSMRHVYVNGLENVLDHLRAWPRFRFIYISSTSVYGQTDGAWVDEKAATKPMTESGRVVLEAEQLLRARLPDAVVLRFAGIYGPGRLLRSEALLTGAPLAGDPERWLNLIHVDDGAAAVVAAGQHAQDGSTFNVADGTPARRGEFFACLAELLGAPAPRFDAQQASDPTNRRIDGRLLRETLQLQAAYPSFRAGLPASLQGDADP